MRKLLVLIACIVSSAVGADDSPTQSVRDALAAYERAASLGHKQTAFAHALTAFDRARRLAKNDDELLFEATYAYGLAGVAVREPDARHALKDALTYIEAQHGAASDALLKPLILTAEDALWRLRPNEAYAFFKRTLDLEAASAKRQPLVRARAYAGLAKQYRDVDDFVRAVPAAEEALLALDAVTKNSDPEHEVAVRKKVGDVFLAAGELSRAQPLYETALEAAWAARGIVEDRMIRSLIKRLIGVHDMNGEQDKVRAYCHTMGTSDFKVGGGGILYDPSGRLWPGNRVKRGAIHARFDVNLDCRLEKIHVVATELISEEDAYAILGGLVYAPTYRGKIEHYHDFRTSMFVSVE